MHISYVKIKNYRGIKSDEFESSPFTCAIGENNAGKSTILLAISLFFSGTALGKSDFYNEDETIEIEVTFSNVEQSDVNRLSTEHRERINEIIIDKKLTLTRRYNTDGRSAIMCNRSVPKDGRFDKEVIDSLLKGKRGKEIGEIMGKAFHDYSSEFKQITTQGDAKDKILEIITKLPPEQLEVKLADLPTGIDNSIKIFLPEPIYIAAVKDLKDDVKSKETTTFGKLLNILLKFIESSSHFEKISESFNELHSLLNVIRDAEKVSDKRVEKLQAIESQIGTFLSENFPKSKVEIDIPKPELKQVFSNARILIDDGVRDIIETKGDGIKRAVTFALLRTYVAQLKQQKKETDEIKKTKISTTVVRETKKEEYEEEKEEEVNEQPYIFLFEEPELYLHPNAQKILFEALENLAAEKNQVFVTTHSPLFFSPQSTGTFIKVIKEYPAMGKPFGKFLTVNLLKEMQAKDAFQIICYENNTAAFFANKVLFVEGDSDLIYVKEVARLLNSEWSFENRNIPIISINGKSNIKRFIEFYTFFKITCYCIVDSDALIDGFERFDVSEEIKQDRSLLLQKIDSLAEKQAVSGDLNSQKIKALTRKYSWQNRYKRLKEIGQLIISGTAPSKDDIEELGLLFSEEENNKRRTIFTDPSIQIPEKSSLLEKLRTFNIFILSHGAIENYYPGEIVGDDKPTKALNAVKFLGEQSDCRTHLPTIKNGETDVCELEVIFSKIFS